jgi:hypothetical protein
MLVTGHMLDRDENTAMHYSWSYLAASTTLRMAASDVSA